MELHQQNVNVIAVVWENDVLIPVALRWTFWTGSSGGRRIIIIPTKGIVIQKLKKAIGTRERPSSFKSKQRKTDKKDLYYDFKTRHGSSSSRSQIYKLYQKHVSETKQSSAFDYPPPKPRRPPYLWSRRENGDSTKAQPAQQVGTTGGPSSSSEPTKTQPSQKVGTTDGPSSRGPTKTQPGKEFGTTGSPSSSSGPTKAQPAQKVGTTDSPSSRGPTKTQPSQKVGTTDGPSSRGPTKTQPGKEFGTTGSPSSSSGPTKTQPAQKVGTTDSPSSRGPTKTQPSQKVGTTDGPSSRGPTKTQAGKEFGTAGSPSSSSGPTKAQPAQKVGTTDSPSSRGPTKTQPSQKVGTTGSPSSRGPTKTQPGQQAGPPKKQPDQQVGGTVNKPSSSASTQPKPEFSQFEKECLAEHNKFRATHGAPPLTLNRNLCKYSQEWADRLIKIGRMEHRTEGKYGENLYMSSGMKVDARKPVKSWYDEIQYYKYGSDFSSNTGHFTQVVWKGSKELGCAFAEKGNTIIVVANYSPPGNVQGQFAENVLRPKN